MKKNNSINHMKIITLIIGAIYHKILINYALSYEKMIVSVIIFGVLYIYLKFRKNINFIDFLLQNIFIIMMVRIMPYSMVIVFTGFGSILIIQYMLKISNQNILLLLLLLLLYALLATLFLNIAHMRVIIMCIFTTQIVVGFFYVKKQWYDEYDEKIKKIENDYNKEICNLEIIEKQRVEKKLNETLVKGIKKAKKEMKTLEKYVEIGACEEARFIVKQQVEDMRKAMSESRVIMDELRSLLNEQVNFVVKLKENIEVVEKKYNLNFVKNIKIGEIENDMSHYLSETLMMIIIDMIDYIYKTSIKIDNINLLMKEERNILKIQIIDDGKRYEVSSLGKKYIDLNIEAIISRIESINGSFKMKDGDILNRTIISIILD